MPRKVLIAHSPDTDDLFMFWALKTGKISDPRFDFEIIGRDIEKLNQTAKSETYDITALSFHAYAKLTDKYALLSSGASMAESGYGPMIVSPHRFTLSDLKNLTIAVPGENTTAFLLLKIAQPEFNHIVVPAPDILKTIADGQADAGLLIHEGQIHYAGHGYHVIHRVIDTWKDIAGNLPLPLGCSAVKKSLGIATMQALSHLQKQSIAYGLAHRDAARDWCLMQNPVLTAPEAERYLDWYVNKRTLDLGTDGLEALKILYSTAKERGIFRHDVAIEVI